MFDETVCPPHMAPATLRKQWGVDELTPGRRQHLLSDGVFDVFVKGLKGFFFVNVTLNPPVCTENSGSGIPWLRQTEIIWLVPKLHFSSNALGGRGGDRAGSKAGGVPLPPKKASHPPPPSSGREAIPPARVPKVHPPTLFRMSVHVGELAGRFVRIWQTTPTPLRV